MPRRLNLLDLAIVIAGCAVGMALGRYFAESLASVGSGFRSGRVGAAYGWFSSMGLALTAAVLAMRVRRPRPPWQELRHQPGFVAGVMVLTSVTLAMPQAAVFVLTPGLSGPRYFFARIVLSGSGYGYGVLLGWIAMRLLGVWRPEAGVIDRLGRSLGWMWIATYAVTPVLHRWGL